MTIVTHDDYWNAKDNIRRLLDCSARGLILPDAHRHLDELIESVDQWERDNPRLSTSTI